MLACVLLAVSILPTWYVINKQLYYPSLEHHHSLGMVSLWCGVSNLKVDSTSAKLWVKSTGDYKVRVVYTDGKQEFQTKWFPLSQETNWTRVIRLQNLQPSTTHYYSIESEITRHPKVGSFTTFPAIGEHKNFKFK